MRSLINLLGRSCCDYGYPEYERSIVLNDYNLTIAWPFVGEPLLANKEAEDAAFKAAEYFEW